MNCLTKEDAYEMSKEAAKIIADKKCEEIVMLDVGEMTPVADYFIVATVSSSPQMSAVLNDVGRYFRSKKRKALGVKDDTFGSQWVLADYGFLVIHLFTKEGRDYYSLEDVWHGAHKEEIDS